MFPKNFRNICFSDLNKDFQNLLWCLVQKGKFQWIVLIIFIKGRNLKDAEMKIILKLRQYYFLYRLVLECKELMHKICLDSI